MLIDFRILFPKYNIKPKGVLHIGSNVAEERDVYNELGIKKQIWIEGNAEIAKTLAKNISSNPEAHSFNAVISDKCEKVKFNISNNGSQSSSILELGTHSIVHPTVFYVDTVEVDAITVAHLYEQMKEHEAWFNRDDYDFLNCDLQGAELKALMGMNGYLHGFKWAYLEVNKEELYKGCALVGDIDDYMKNYGFVRVETYWAGLTGWGDALYCQKRLL